MAYLGKPRSDGQGPHKRGPGRPDAHRGHGAGPARRPGRRPKPYEPLPQGTAPPRPLPTPAATAWENVATWYDKLVGDEGSDYHRNVILPAAVRLLAPRQGERVLDLCCGQGVFCRLLVSHDVGQVLGVDASPTLIEMAKARFSDPRIEYRVADARDLGPLANGTFDAAACLMAVQDMDDIQAAFAGMARALKVGGRAVVIMMHPCFRVPRQSSWGWDEQQKAQYRRIDRYLLPLDVPITTHPGGKTGEYTTFFHRPLSAYLTALGSVGLGVVACEELVSHHVSQAGTHSRGENRARQDFPIFLALKAVKIK